MVQLQNPDRLNQVIKFGTIDDGEDINGSPVKKFVQIGKPTLCGNWQLTTNQIIQIDGLDKKQSFIVIVHHRKSWAGITDAELNGEQYNVANIYQDPYNNPTAYDQIVLKKVGDANDE